MPGMMSRIFEGDSHASDQSIEAHADPELQQQHESAAELQLGDNTTRIEQGVDLEYSGHVGVRHDAHDGLTADDF